MSNRKDQDQVDEFIELLGELIDDCNELLLIKPRGQSFFESIQASAEDMIENVEDYNNYTDNQYRAYEGWRNGVDKWKD